MVDNTPDAWSLDGTKVWEFKTGQPQKASDHQLDAYRYAQMPMLWSQTVQLSRTRRWRARLRWRTHALRDRLPKRRYRPGRPVAWGARENDYQLGSTQDRILTQLPLDVQGEFTHLMVDSIALEMDRLRAGVAMWAETNWVGQHMYGFSAFEKTWHPTRTPALLALDAMGHMLDGIY